MAGKFKHGLYRTPEFRHWLGMRRRCYGDLTGKAGIYKRRGITVCDRWRESFANFYADMGAKPSPKHSLDRVDNDKGYSPDNCRWADRKQQSRNCQNTRRVEYHGTIMPLAAVYDLDARPISYNAFRSRLLLGWDIEAALCSPKGSRKESYQ